jgi:hypothetical protein
LKIIIIKKEKNSTPSSSSCLYFIFYSFSDCCCCFCCRTFFRVCDVTLLLTGPFLYLSILFSLLCSYFWNTTTKAGISVNGPISTKREYFTSSSSSTTFGGRGRNNLVRHWYVSCIICSIRQYDL